MYVVCQPHDYKFFKEYLELIHFYLPHEVIPKIDTLDPNHVYMFVLAIPDQFITCKNIIYLNTEQLTNPKWYNQIKSYLEKGIPVIDYDLYQSQLFSSPYHHYFPYNYEPHLTILVKNTIPTYDVGMCSVNSVRRLKIANELSALGVNVMNINLWGDVRDQWISRCKILLNIHYDENYKIFEHLRCDRWIVAGLHIVTEPSVSDHLLDLSEYITIVPYEEMVDKVVSLLLVSKKPREFVDSYIIENRHKQSMSVASILSKK